MVIEKIALPFEERVEIAVFERPKGYRHEHSPWIVSRRIQQA
jgi:hypothetical protein